MISCCIAWIITATLTRRRVGFRFLTAGVWVGKEVRRRRPGCVKGRARAYKTTRGTDRSRSAEVCYKEAWVRNGTASSGECFLKKVIPISKVASLSKHHQENVYLAIQSVQQTESLKIQLLCKVTWAPRSSYYKWLNYKPSQRQLEIQVLTKVMFALYRKVEGIIAYRQLTLHMSKEMKRKINHKHVKRLIRIQGIPTVIRRKKKKYARSTIVWNGMCSMLLWSLLTLVVRGYHNFPLIYSWSTRMAIFRVGGTEFIQTVHKSFFFELL